MRRRLRVTDHAMDRFDERVSPWLSTPASARRTLRRAVGRGLIVRRQPGRDHLQLPLPDVTVVVVVRRLADVDQVVTCWARPPEPAGDAPHVA